MKLKYYCTYQHPIPQFEQNCPRLVKRKVWQILQCKGKWIIISVYSQWWELLASITLIFGSSWVCHNLLSKYNTTRITMVTRHNSGENPKVPSILFLRNEYIYIMSLNMKRSIKLKMKRWKCDSWFCCDTSCLYFLF